MSFSIWIDRAVEEGRWSDLVEDDSGSVPSNLLKAARAVLSARREERERMNRICEAELQGTQGGGWICERIRERGEGEG